MGQIPNEDFLPLFVGSLGVVRAHDNNLSGTVVVGALSLVEVELAIACQTFHAGNLQIVVRTFTVAHLGFLVLGMPTGVPEGGGIVVDQVTEVRAFARVAVGAGELVGRGNHLCADDVLCGGQSVEHFCTQGIVLSHEDVVVLDNLKVLDELFSLIFGNELEIPFAGVLVGCTIGVPSPHPEAHFLLCASVYTIVAPRRCLVGDGAVTVLMEIRAATGSWVLSKADADDVAVVANAVGLNVVKACIVEHDVACLCDIGCRGELAKGLGSQADVCTHAGILNHDAVAGLALGKFPDEVRSFSVECAVDNLVQVVLAEGSSHSLVDEATLVIS